MRLVYILGSWLICLLLLPVLALTPKTRGGFWQRFGLYKPEDVPQKSGPRLWLHGASAGDLLALAPIIRGLRRELPEACIIVSTITNTGMLMARERLVHDVDAIIYAPWDLFGATRRAMAAMRPNLLVLEYAELWPNLIHAARRSGAKVAITNGYFSQRFLGRYRLLFALIGNPLTEISLFLLRGEEQRERAISIGAPAERVIVTGDSKYDALVDLSVAPVGNAPFGFPPDAPVLFAGSTHRGEEELILDAYRRLGERFPELRLVLAPRYVERAPKVLALCRAAGFAATLRSQGNSEGTPVVVLDTIGELGQLYHFATVVFVGGSFVRRGGQNILEPAAKGKPVFFGPHTFNFAEPVRLLLGRGGIQVRDAAQLAEVLGDLLGKPATLLRQGQLARETVASLVGATEANVRHLLRLVNAP